MDSYRAASRYFSEAIEILRARPILGEFDQRRMIEARLQLAQLCCDWSMVGIFCSSSSSSSSLSLPSPLATTSGSFLLSASHISASHIFSWNFGGIGSGGGGGSGTGSGEGKQTGILGTVTPMASSAAGPSTKIRSKSEKRKGLWTRAWTEYFAVVIERSSIAKRYRREIGEAQMHGKARMRRKPGLLISTIMKIEVLRNIAMLRSRLKVLAKKQIWEEIKAEINAEIEAEEKAKEEEAVAVAAAAADRKSVV